jgi:hypothetical protein
MTWLQGHPKPINNQQTNMKTFKDLFLDQSADVYGTPRRIIKASLRKAMADNGLPTGLAHAGSNKDDLSESDQKRSEAVADKRAMNLHQDIRPIGTSLNRAGSMPH